MHLIVGGASLYIEVVRHDYALFFGGVFVRSGNNSKRVNGMSGRLGLVAVSCAGRLGGQSEQ